MRDFISTLMGHDKSQDLYVVEREYNCNCPQCDSWEKTNPEICYSMEAVLSRATACGEHRVTSVYWYQGATGEIQEINFRYEYSNHGLVGAYAGSSWIYCDNGQGIKTWCEV